MSEVPWLKPGTRCAASGQHVLYEFDHCRECGDLIDTCPECEVNTSCCSCGNNHSIDCPNG